MKQGNDKLHQIAQEIKDFCYENDYWDFMAYYEEQQETDYVDMDGVVEDIVTVIDSNPTHFIDYLERWEEKKADKIAAEIKALIADQKRKELNDKLFDAMSKQIGVMAEWDDDEEGLRQEIETADDEILKCYTEMYLD